METGFKSTTKKPYARSCLSPIKFVRRAFGMIFCVCLLLSHYKISAQQIFSASSFENLTGKTNCTGSCDAAPKWGSTITPYVGTGFIGFHEFLTFGGETWSVPINQVLATGNTYTYSVMAAIVPITASTWGSTGNGNHDGVIYVYASSGACLQNQLIGTIQLFISTHTNQWTRFCFVFTAAGNWNHLTFRAKTEPQDYIDCSYMGIDDVLDNITVTSTNASCANGGSATATATGGTPPYTYSWNPTGQITSTATGLSAGTYTVTAVDGNGCFHVTQTVTITQNSGITATTSFTPANCGNGGTATVTPSGGSVPYTYTWSPSGGNATTATGLGAGTYSVIVSDAGGCSSQAVVTITSTSGFTATNTQTNISCFGMSNGSVSVTPNGGSVPYSYVWNTNPVQTSPSVSNLPAGSYSCTITDASGCTAVQTVTLIQPPPMTVTITSIPASCILTDGSASVTVSGGMAPYSYSWMTNPVQTSSSVNNLGPGNYSILITDSRGCSQIQNATITGGTFPLANFTFNPETLLIGNTSVNFTDLSSNAYAWSWNFGDGNSANQQNPIHPYSDTGTYCITLIVADPSSQCFDTITKCLKVVDAQFSFYIPNSFTPNGDFMNEVFFGKGRGIKEYNIWLFDRWGNQIWDCHYEEKNASWDSNSQADLPSFCKWDGTAAKGGLDINGNSKQLAQEDVYVWKVSLTDVFDKNHKYVGHVSIVR